MRRAATRLGAAWIAEPVLERASAGAGGTVLGCFGSTVHAALGGFVVVIQPEAALRMPNGVGVPVGATNGVVRVGDPATLRPGRLDAGGLEIAWDVERPPGWSAAVPRWPRGELRSAGARAGAILAAKAHPSAPGATDDDVGDDGARQGLGRLLGAVETMDADAAAEAAALLIGRGSGLTPVGDDVLAAAALTVNALHETAGLETARARAWVSALAPPELRNRTTPISATLLELAIRGDGIGPARALLDPRPAANAELIAAVARLAALGHSTGRAYVNTIGALLGALAAPEEPANHPEKEHVR